jgi:hypothetical protein
MSEKKIEKKGRQFYKESRSRTTILKSAIEKCDNKYPILTKGRSRKVRKSKKKNSDCRRGVTTAFIDDKKEIK